ncbi:hypothetical protein GCM10010411_80690 [Actinomadura fulvescens]|uniref:Uncharacterized protein n=1 Tax=Actinomadura fulvescens TaxID=46160 RepID=A0ABP6D0S1_9ACTN
MAGRVTEERLSSRVTISMASAVTITGAQRMGGAGVPGASRASRERFLFMAVTLGTGVSGSPLSRDRVGADRADPSHLTEASG